MTSLLSLALAGNAHAADDTGSLLSPPTANLEAVDDDLAAAIDQALPTADELTPVVTVTQSADGDIEVSVRLESPESGSVSTDTEASSGSISGGTAGDTTSTPLPQPPPGAHASEASTGIPETTQQGTTGVSIEIPSAKDDAGTTPRATWDSAPATVDAVASTSLGATSSAPDLDRSPSTEREISSDLAESEQEYHDENSQYQYGNSSNSEVEDEAWSWRWYLSVDCSEVTSSLSSESGSSSSPVWDWDWEWEWSCDTGPRPPPTDDERDDTPSMLADSHDPASRGDPAQTTETTEADWLWTWTFALCGEPVTLTMPFAIGTNFRWTWEWTWSWTCTAPEGCDADDPPPVPLASAPVADEATSTSGEGHAGGAPVTAGPSQAELGLTLPPAFEIALLPVWLTPRTPSLDIALSSALEISLLPIWVTPRTPSLDIAVGVEGLPVDAVLQATEIEVLEAVPGLVGEDASTAYEGSSAEPTRLGLGVRPDAVAHGATPAPHTAVPAPPHARSDPGTSGARRADRRHSASEPERNTSRSGAPHPVPPRSASGASGTSAGFMPSGGATGVAVLSTLLLIGLPELMVCLGATPELSPRGIHGASIDRPG